MLSLIWRYMIVLHNEPASSSIIVFYKVTTVAFAADRTQIGRCILNRSVFQV